MPTFPGPPVEALGLVVSLLTAAKAGDLPTRRRGVNYVVAYRIGLNADADILPHWQYHNSCQWQEKNHAYCQRPGP